MRNLGGEFLRLRSKNVGVDEISEDWIFDWDFDFDNSDEIYVSVRRQ